MAVNVRYLTVSRIAFELVTAMSADDNLRFNKILFSCFRQLESGETAHYEETDNTILNIALREAVSELETGFATYMKRASGGKRETEATDHQRPTNGIPVVGQCPTKEENNKNNLIRTEKKKKIFIPPSVDDVRSYCQERGNSIDAEAFCDYYTARAWELKPGQKMRDWQAAVRTWEKNRKEWGNGPDRTDTSNRVRGQRELYSI